MSHDADHPQEAHVDEVPALQESHCSVHGDTAMMTWSRASVLPWAASSRAFFLSVIWARAASAAAIDSPTAASARLYHTLHAQQCCFAAQILEPAALSRCLASMVHCGNEERLELLHATNASNSAN